MSKVYVYRGEDNNDYGLNFVIYFIGFKPLNYKQDDYMGKSFIIVNRQDDYFNLTKTEGSKKIELSLDVVNDNFTLDQFKQSSLLECLIETGFSENKIIRAMKRLFLKKRANTQYQLNEVDERLVELKSWENK